MPLVELLIIPKHHRQVGFIFSGVSRFSNYSHDNTPDSPGRVYHPEYNKGGTLRKGVWSYLVVCTL